MDWHELPFSARAGILGLGVGVFLGWLTQSGPIAVIATWLCFLIGLVADAARYGWKLYWALTLECSWCRARINRFFTRNKLVSRELHGQEHWYCSPRCYTEWHRRHHQDRKQINLLNEGNPLVIISKGIGG